MKIYQRATRRQKYVPQEQSEATFICGRRSGKTIFLGALIALYVAFVYHGVPSGEHAYVVLIAPFRKQAQEAFRAVKKYIRNSPILRQCVARIGKDEIVLRNGVIIACWTCSAVNVRGASVICAICDEIAFWPHGETSANPEEEVMEALRPAMATLTGTKLIKISTPFRKEGILWNEFQRRHELDHLVWQLSTAEMNPTGVSAAFLEKERQRNEEKYLREYEAQFTDHIAGWIGSNTLETCIRRGCTELPPHRDATYVAAIDPALKRDDWALVIAERTSDGTIIVARTMAWTGTAKEPLVFESVCEEIARILKSYDINVLFGDQHCAVVIQQTFLKLGITFREFNVSARTKMDVFSNLKHLLIGKKIQLPDDPKLLSQFRSLREHKMANGNVEIRSGHGAKDDLVFAAALAAYYLTDDAVDPRWLDLLAPQLAEAEPVRWRFDPDTCRLHADCANSPRCLDRGVCQYYVSQGLTSPQPPSTSAKVDNFCGQNAFGQQRVCATIAPISAQERDTSARVTMLKR